MPAVDPPAEPDGLGRGRAAPDSPRRTGDQARAPRPMSPPLLFLLARPGRWGVPAAGALVVVVGWLLTRTSFFYADDFLYASLFSEPWSAAQLSRSYFGHLGPAFALLSTVFYHWFGLDWSAATVVMLGCLLGLSVATRRLVDATLGRRTLLGILAGVSVALTPAIVTQVLWWGAAITQVIPLAAGLSAMGCLVRWIRTGRPTHLVGLALMFGLALAFFEKAVVFSAYAFLWALLAVDAGVPWRERVANAAGRWPAWAILAILSAIDLAVYFAGPYRADSGPSAPVGALASFVVRGVTLGAIPSLFGVDLQGASAPVVAGVATLTLLAMAHAAVRLIRSAPSTRNVLGFAVLATAVGQVPLAIGRAAITGGDGGRLLRYQMEPVAIVLVSFAVALGQACLQCDGDLARAVSAGHGASPVRGVPRWLRLARLVAPLLVLLWSGTMVAAVRANPGALSRTWATNVREQWPSDPPPMVDGPVDHGFVYDWMHPYNLRSRVLATMGLAATFTVNPQGTWAIDSQGQLGPAAFAASTSSEATACARPGAPAVVNIEHPAGESTLVELQYAADTKASFGVSTGTPAQDVNLQGLAARTEVPAGRGAVVFQWLGRNDLKQLVVHSLSGQVCINQISVGDLVVRRG